MKTFTPFNSREIQQKEKEMLQFLKDNLKEEKKMGPSNEAVSNVLGYSKALSIKLSEKVGYIENLLN